MPIQSPGVIGLRRAQVGAIHASAAHFSRSSSPAILVLPTGTGKTAVLMISSFLERATRVLVVSPSRLLRSQLKEEFSTLNVLKNLGVVPQNLITPSVIEVTKRITTQDKWAELREFDVVVGTPFSISPAIEQIPEPPDGLFDLVLVDEAHHSPASTWNNILTSFPSAKKILVTATPFRRDKQEIRGNLVYSYPIKEAYNDGILGKINYIPVPQLPGRSSDISIAIRAEQVFNEDRQAGFEHSLMVRTDGLARANQLDAIYKEFTNLRLRIIHSGYSYKHIKTAIKELKRRDLDGIICVNMLGEGFDFPNLKIAAIHAPHKSLEVTLQFIGRFSRVGGDQVGVAKFLAIPSEIEIETEKLFNEAAIWQEIIPNLGQARVEQEEFVRQTIEQFDQPEITSKKTEDLSLYSLYPYAHVKVYKVDEDVDVSKDLTLPHGYKTEYKQSNEDSSIAVLITQETRRPKWTNLSDFNKNEYDLIVIYFNRRTNLLFINSSRRVDSLYEKIVKQLAPGGYKVLPLSKVNKVLIGLRNPRFFNIGMKNRIPGSNTESYRIVAGPIAQNAVDRTDGQLYHRGHIFGKGDEDGKPTTIGYSSASKVWSNRNLQIPELIRWCSALADKIVSQANVVTHSGLDNLPVGEEVDEIPQNVLDVDWNEHVFSEPFQIAYTNDQDEIVHEDLLDVDLSIDYENTNAKNIRVLCKGKQLDWAADFSLSRGTYFSRVRGKPQNAFIERGGDEINLVDYLNGNPLIFYFTDGSTLSGNDLMKFDIDPYVPLAPEYLLAIDWAGANVDITNEFGESPEGRLSIHEFIRQRNLANAEVSISVYDHRTGEVADVVSFCETETKVTIQFFHCKKSGGRNPGNRVKDVYEVCGQALKSRRWIGREQELLGKLRKRIRDGSVFDRGTLGQLTEMFNRFETKKVGYEIYVVQPGISKEEVSQDIQFVLAATNDYLKRSIAQKMVLFCS